MKISAPADAAPSRVMTELATAVAEAPQVLKKPPPKIVYRGEQGGEGRYEASYWLLDSADDESAQSDLRVSIWYRLRRSGLIAGREAFEPSREELRDALRNLPFLSSATPVQIEILAQNTRAVRYGKGEVLFHQNDRSDDLFLIHSGMLDISVTNGARGEETIASIGAGSFVGERSLMTGEPRSATVRAAGDATLFVVPKAAMGELLRDYPDLAQQIAQVMAERDEERQQTTLRMQTGNSSGRGDSILQRIRVFFSLSN
jgi:CRP-like cAMP-binding protein